ncbi:MULTISPECIES: indolepyruvate oxidoreductase subunit beta [unclassified Ruminococcus]|uniref:indolepyruvate oxidoreductase subunit beta n=1 Tax=unclassified Ruminococcus TaxID=2608920 RepID=UPI00210C6347|nr:MULTISPECIES: indolepyruvate oxidoreductase subunit beta [unclassified Ruminococcus]MCQ4022947.1 indolepyruvate oxidoreductase subunit beta [Ruminococcus sp. zg-924]MCQ4115355.1 indolepyruvate oxidoreductase subunit beta [Ruminococcus sp. zg-921]
MNDVKSVLIVGVGGQGTLLASRLLGNALLSRDYDVKVSEVHGMSQRGGSVVTYVRYGESVSSPIIELGEADLILSFEALEAARFLPYLKKSGKIIVNTQQIDPMPVVTGNAVYPDDVLGQIKSLGVEVISADALSLAEQAGSVKAVNVVLMGMLAKQTDIEKQVWIDTVKQTVPSKFLELNIKAFELGYNQ